MSKLSVLLKICLIVIRFKSGVVYESVAFIKIKIMYTSIYLLEDMDHGKQKQKSELKTKKLQSDTAQKLKFFVRENLIFCAV